MRRMRNLLVTSLLALLVAACAPTSTDFEHVVITVIGTNDVHGELVARDDRGGLTTFSGYVAAIRAARANDGAVLLVDGGDMWQGTLESNLNEGEAIVEIYNVLGYAAATIGNHDFDFGPVGPKAIPEDDGDDPQGALRARAAGANFPLVAANLIDRLHSPAQFLRDLPGRMHSGAVLLIASPYTWLETFTKKENWLGGFKRDGEPVTTLDGLHAELDEHFTLMTDPVKVPFVIRETANKHQHTLSEVTLWKKKSMISIP